MQAIKYSHFLYCNIFIFTAKLSLWFKCHIYLDKGLKSNFRICIHIYNISMH